MRLAAELSVTMPATAAARAQGHDEDYSWYENFSQTSDQEVHDLLDRAAREMHLAH